MPHGERSEKLGHAGKEYWGKRLGPKMAPPGRIAKQLTHTAERAEKRRIEHEAKAARPEDV
jgi:hypothetical protein